MEGNNPEQSSLNRVSVEIWTLILDEVLRLQGIFDAPGYLGEEVFSDSPSDHIAREWDYEDVERHRQRLSLVCRSWHEYAESRRYQFVRIHTQGFETKLRMTDCNAMAHAKRIDFQEHMSLLVFPLSKVAPRPMTRVRLDLSWITRCLRECRSLVAFEMHIFEFGPTEEEEIFAELIKNGQNLQTLRHLGITTPFNSGKVADLFGGISNTFPNLRSLDFTDMISPTKVNQIIRNLRLPRLEIYRHMSLSFYQRKFDSWDLPSLQTLILQPHTSSSVIALHDLNYFPNILTHLGRTLRRLCVHWTIDAIGRQDISWGSFPVLEELALHTDIGLSTPLPVGHSLRRFGMLDSHGPSMQDYVNRLVFGGVTIIGPAYETAGLILFLSKRDKDDGDSVWAMEPWSRLYNMGEVF